MTTDLLSNRAPLYTYQIFLLSAPLQLWALLYRGSWCSQRQDIVCTTVQYVEKLDSVMSQHGGAPSYRVLLVVIHWISSKGKGQLKINGTVVWGGGGDHPHCPLPKPTPVYGVQCSDLDAWSYHQSGSHVPIDIQYSGSSLYDSKI